MSHLSWRFHFYSMITAVMKIDAKQGVGQIIPSQNFVGSTFVFCLYSANTWLCQMVASISLQYAKHTIHISYYQYQYQYQYQSPICKTHIVLPVSVLVSVILIQYPKTHIVLPSPKSVFCWSSEIRGNINDNWCRFLRINIISQLENKYYKSQRRRFFFWITWSFLAALYEYHHTTSGPPPPSPGTISSLFSLRMSIFRPSIIMNVRNSK